MSNSLDDAEMTTLLPEVRLRNPDGNVAEVSLSAMETVTRRRFRRGPQNLRRLRT